MTPKELEWPVFLMHYLPRLSFALFIQLFAFFFLRLYKNNLEDAKYFQNELTNLNAKTTALRLAVIMENKDQFEKLVDDLFATERNFKLQKDETLQGLEREKIEKEVDSKIMNALRGLLTAYQKDTEAKS